MKEENDKSGFYAAALFLIWPLLSLASALKNRKSAWAKNICWAFVAFFGFTFAIGAENERADIVRYIQGYQSMHTVQMTFSSTVEYLEQREEIDIARPLISIVLSRFSDNPALLTLVYGIIFGFFFSRNMWYVLERLNGSLKPVTILLIVCLFLVVPIWDMNGFRMWTATHMFLYGLLPYLCEGEIKKLWVSATSILVHFALILPVAVLAAYMVAGNFLIVYFSFFALTFFLSEIDIHAFNQFVEAYAPEALQDRTAGYRGEGFVETFREGETEVVWYAVLYTKALNWAVAGFLGLLFFTGRDFFNNNRNWLSLFCFTLLFYGVANILSTIPSGARYLALANLSALSLIIFYLHYMPREKWMKRFIWAASPALLLFIVVSVRIGLYSTSATAVMGNPVLALFIMNEHISLNDVMRMIL
jgi:hypothetical protein